jgi:taurine transport system substrate-binding protein
MTRKIGIKNIFRNSVASVVGAVVLSFASIAVADDSVNVGYFLELAAPSQVAKVDKVYDAAMGVDVNWAYFSTSVEMTQAMIDGDIDIAYSLGLVPFVTAAQQGAPLKVVGIAVVYEANDCFVNNSLGISFSNASLLEGKSVAVPLNTMTDFSFRRQMEALGVDVLKMTIINQAPADGVVSLIDGSVAMACIFGGASARAAGEVGTPIMSAQQKKNAGIGSFDVISVTEKFAAEYPDLLKNFLKVTNEANANWLGSDVQIRKVAADAGLDINTTRVQIAGFVFPSTAEQKATYFGSGGVASFAAATLGGNFTDTNVSNFESSLDSKFDGSFLE